MMKYLSLSLQSSLILSLFTSFILLSACSGNAPRITNTTTTEATASPPPTMPVTSIPTASPLTQASTQTDAPTETSTPWPKLTPTALPTNVVELPNAEGYTWQMIVAGLSQPVGLVSSMDGSGRLFVVDKQGVIYILRGAKVDSRPFLDLRDRVGTKGATTRGLLGLVFHPNYEESGFFYLHYTDQHGNIVIARYRVSGDADLGDPDSEVVLIRVTPPVGEHNGGDLAFGPDGYLYISFGDGGGGGYGDQAGNAQNTESLLGKILRLDVDGGDPYGIPADNPFAVGGGRPEVWAYGLRNPWRIAFDPSTGNLYIADVGETRWEEVDFLPAGSPGGANLGWNAFEGTHTYRGKPSESKVFIPPLVEYSHEQGCSIIGGKVYRGKALPEFNGVYLYGDYCQKTVWGLLHKPDGTWQNEILFQAEAFITSFGQDEAGEVYLVGLTGQIFKLVKSKV